MTGIRQAAALFMRSLTGRTYLRTVLQDRQSRRGAHEYVLQAHGGARERIRDRVWHYFDENIYKAPGNAESRGEFSRAGFLYSASAGGRPDGVRRDYQGGAALKSGGHSPSSSGGESAANLTQWRAIRVLRTEKPVETFRFPPVLIVSSIIGMIT